jgi:hypothetical protein
MPIETIRLNYSKDITAEQFENISCGLIPEEMEDKWFAYVEGHTLFLHRSWTGTCIFRVELRPVLGGYIVSSAEVNNDPEQHRPRHVDKEISLVNRLIEYLGSERE